MTATTVGQPEDWIRPEECACLNCSQNGIMQMRFLRTSSDRMNHMQHEAIEPLLKGLQSLTVKRPKSQICIFIVVVGVLEKATPDENDDGRKNHSLKQRQEINSNVAVNPSPLRQRSQDVLQDLLTNDKTYLGLKRSPISPLKKRPKA